MEFGIFTIGAEYNGVSMVENFIKEIWWKSPQQGTFTTRPVKPLHFMPQEFLAKNPEGIHYKQIMKELHEVLQKEQVKEVRMSLYALPAIEYCFDLAQLPNLRTRKIKIVPI